MIWLFISFNSTPVHFISFTQSPIWPDSQFLECLTESREYLDNRILKNLKLVERQKKMDKVNMVINVIVKESNLRKYIRYKCALDFKVNSKLMVVKRN